MHFSTHSQTVRSEALREEAMILLCHDNGHGVIQHALPKDQHVEGGVHIQSMEDGQSGHWVHRRDEAPKGKTGGEGGGFIPPYNTPLP